MKENVVEEVMKEIGKKVDKEVLKCYCNICDYYNKNYKIISRFLGVI